MPETTTEELILTKNFAEDPEISGRAAQHVKKLWEQVVRNRQALDDRFYQFFNIWNTVFDIRYYEGHSQVYSPALRKNVEFAVRNLRRNLFPTDDYFSVEPVTEEERPQVEKLKRFMTWQQTNKIQLKRYVTPFLRQLCMYGWSPIKVVWDRESKKVYTHEKETKIKTKMELDPMTGTKVPVYAGEEQIISQVEREIKTKDHPTFLPIDIFSFYVYPWTCWDVKDAQAVMEELLVGKHDLLNKEKSGDYVNVDRIINTPTTSPTSKRVYSKEQRLFRLGFDTNLITEVPKWNLIEFWGKFDLHDDGNEIDCVITVSDGAEVCLQVRQNPYYDQEPPYAVAKLDELVGEFYGHGLIEPLQALQYLLNDTKNQANDVMIYSLSPIVKYDPGAVVNPNSLQFAPGAMWAVVNPESVVFERPPDVSQSAWNVIQGTSQEIDEYPGFEKVPMTGRRPATQVTAIQQDRGITILDWSENIEVMVMNPFLKKQYMLNQQFLDDEVAFKVMGKPLEKMSPEELIGDYHFYWLGANQTQNIVVRSQQMLNGLEVAMKIPQTMDEQGDFWYMFKRWWKEGLGLDGDHRVTKKIDLTEMMDPQQENLILALGKQLPVNMMDRDEEHIQTHLPVANSPRLSPFIQSVLKFHIQLHLDKLSKNKMSQQLAQTQGEQNPQGPPAEQYGGNQGMGQSEQQVSPGYGNVGMGGGG